MAKKVTMFHPDVGTIQCSPSAARVHAKSGWEPVDDVENTTVKSVAGDVLTTASVFPPESFDDDTDNESGSND